MCTAQMMHAWRINPMQTLIRTLSPRSLLMLSQTCKELRELIGRYDFVPFQRRPFAGCLSGAGFYVAHENLRVTHRLDLADPSAWTTTFAEEGGHLTILHRDAQLCAKYADNTHIGIGDIDFTIDGWTIDFLLLTHQLRICHENDTSTIQLRWAERNHY